MMDITGKVIDNEKILIKLEKFPKLTLRNLRTTLYIGANSIRNTILKSMQETKKAPWFYKRGKKKHYPSAPGYPPARDTGELMSRIVADERYEEIEVGVKAGAPYAKYLEGGTWMNWEGGGRSGGIMERMAPRPFLQPALDKELPRIKRNILKAAEDGAKS